MSTPVRRSHDQVLDEQPQQFVARSAKSLLLVATMAPLPHLIGFAVRLNVSLGREQLLASVPAQCDTTGPI